ncbi:3-beta hydroxysteroid dehydrogenase/isomerase family protein [Leptospira inadai serovar Lyme str. 10]|uniref:3-beta hydroxysteroid dehydrogenase/isomerase family protein n=2 Tax=Leptospira inadai serovar Lyme TaxID=293084 RepID=V6HKA0_9LEPT|nr:NAD-dependent epimerase/dehydratase family protein [Leptospira inadai]EQA37315.1 3-beta hydroxysteroid dehydrogenase/isomerase family protein [Leptospira inadai serovar Lyme str. 10]PNV73296.1 3-beta hydroxysteroid dehydrogenase [Leptospira inadai serovar Lyme]
MRLLITGASGFVGGAIAKRLKENHSILALSRSAESDAILKKAGIEVFRGNLGAIPTEALRGIDIVIHCAAFVGPWGNRKDFWEANVDGTSQLLDAARAVGVKRFIHMGTEAALFHGQDMIQIDETYPYPKVTPYLYSETKAEAERRVLAANAKEFKTLVLRPRLVWGPGDTSVLPVLKKMVSEGKFLWIDGGKAKTSTTYIQNLVDATELALTRGNGGEAYFITDNEDQTFRSFLTAMMKTQGIDLPKGSVPSFLARSLAFIVEGIWNLFGIKSEPPLLRFATDIMAKECTIKIDKAQKDLGYNPKIKVLEGLAAMRNTVS